MFCSECGEKLNDEVKFCSKCGKPINKKSKNNESLKGSEVIWSPNVIVILSLFFTPIFGSYLQALNWRALNKPAKEKSSMHWHNISILMIVIMPILYGFIVGAFWSLEKLSFMQNLLWPYANAIGITTHTATVHLMNILYFSLWYAFSGRLQSIYIKEKIGKVYSRKSWSIPLMIGIAGLFIYMLISKFILDAALYDAFSKYL